MLELIYIYWVWEKAGGAYIASNGATPVQDSGSECQVCLTGTSKEFLHWKQYIHLEDCIAHSALH